MWKVRSTLLPCRTNKLSPHVFVKPDQDAQSLRPPPPLHASSPINMIRLLVLLLLATGCHVAAFAPPSSISSISISKRTSSSITHHHHIIPYDSHSTSSLRLSGAPLEGLSEERKSNLFQSLLRDLQIEGTPLLGCDAKEGKL